MDSLKKTRGIILLFILLFIFISRTESQDCSYENRFPTYQYSAYIRETSYEGGYTLDYAEIYDPLRNRSIIESSSTTVIDWTRSLEISFSNPFNLTLDSCNTFNFSGIYDIKTHPRSPIQLLLNTYGYYNCKSFFSNQININITNDIYPIQFNYTVNNKIINGDLFFNQFISDQDRDLIDGIDRFESNSSATSSSSFSPLPGDTKARKSVMSDPSSFPENHDQFSMLIFDRASGVYYNWIYENSSNQIIVYRSVDDSSRSVRRTIAEDEVFDLDSRTMSCASSSLFQGILEPIDLLSNATQQNWTYSGQVKYNNIDCDKYSTDYDGYQVDYLFAVEEWQYLGRDLYGDRVPISLVFNEEKASHTYDIFSYQAIVNSPPLDYFQFNLSRCFPYQPSSAESEDPCAQFQEYSTLVTINHVSAGITSSFYETYDNSNTIAIDNSYKYISTAASPSQFSTTRYAINGTCVSQQFQRAEYLANLDFITYIKSISTIKYYNWLIQATNGDVQFIETWSETLSHWKYTSFDNNGITFSPNEYIINITIDFYFAVQSGEEIIEIENEKPFYLPQNLTVYLKTRNGLTNDLKSYLVTIDYYNFVIVDHYDKLSRIELPEEPVEGCESADLIERYDLSIKQPMESLPQSASKEYKLTLASAFHTTLSTNNQIYDWTYNPSELYEHFKIFENGNLVDYTFCYHIEMGKYATLIQNNKTIGIVYGEIASPLYRSDSGLLEYLYKSNSTLTKSSLDTYNGIPSVATEYEDPNSNTYITYFDQDYWDTGIEDSELKAPLALKRQHNTYIVEEWRFILYSQDLNSTYSIKNDGYISDQCQKFRFKDSPLLDQTSTITIGLIFVIFLAGVLVLTITLIAQRYKNKRLLKSIEKNNDEIEFNEYTKTDDSELYINFTNDNEDEQINEIPVRPGGGYQILDEQGDQ